MKVEDQQHQRERAIIFLSYSTKTLTALIGHHTIYNQPLIGPQARSYIQDGEVTQAKNYKKWSGAPQA